MDLAGALQLGELAAAFAALPVFPLFDAAYFIVSVLYLKYEPGRCGQRDGPPCDRGKRGEPGAARPQPLCQRRWGYRGSPRPPAGRLRAEAGPQVLAPVWGQREGGSLKVISWFS